MEILVLIFVVVAFIFYLTADSKSEKFTVSDEQNYPAVKIEPCTNSCQAAMHVSQLTFLTNQAPKLPLTACDRIGECDCKYRHYSDRRQQEDRRTDSFAMRDMYQQDERRGKKRVGRRAEDRYSMA